MQILYDYRDYSFPERTSLTIGNFDGLHLGHRQILDDVITTSRNTGTRSLLITFQPHPLEILNPEKAPSMITPGTEKTHLIENLGIDLLLVLRFDQTLSRLSGRSFVKEILSSALRMQHIFVGKNFVFGHQRSGDVNLLRQMAAELDFTVHVIPEIIIRGCRISSTWIRELIQTGRISQANRLLGRYYSLLGPVVSGEGIGRKLLFPTLNLAPANQVIPQSGVYVTLTAIEGQIYPSVSNVGRRPTVSGRNLTIETHVLDIEISSPPAQMELSFVHRLRSEQKFDSIQQLKSQIQMDCQQTRLFFRRLERFHGQQSRPLSRIQMSSGGPVKAGPPD
ncbi:MAG TPA: bifunctional riboflavin kinase/FAD synthetase [Terriglobia bacterium]|nr:bifunctional riboflavin kinase/FAD synthetase [Terriglobia bacterium]